jgi:2-hydroxychromene-2-carboxylate isomerase
MSALWAEGSAPCREHLGSRWRALTGREPVADPAAVRRLERRMRRRGPYDTPAACLGREWWFAHDRLDQIEERLDALGWRRAA